MDSHIQFNIIYIMRNDVITRHRFSPWTSHTIHRLVSHRTKADASRYKKKHGFAGRKVSEAQHRQDTTRHEKMAIISSLACGLCLYPGHVPDAALKRIVVNRGVTIHLGKALVVWTRCRALRARGELGTALPKDY